MSATRASSSTASSAEPRVASFSGEDGLRVPPTCASLPLTQDAAIGGASSPTVDATNSRVPKVMRLPGRKPPVMETMGAIGDKETGGSTHKPPTWRANYWGSGPGVPERSGERRIGSA